MCRNAVNENHIAMRYASATVAYSLNADSLGADIGERVRNITNAAPAAFVRV